MPQTNTNGLGQLSNVNPAGVIGQVSLVFSAFTNKNIIVMQGPRTSTSHTSAPAQIDQTLAMQRAQQMQALLQSTSSREGNQSLLNMPIFQGTIVQLKKSRTNQ